MTAASGKSSGNSSRFAQRPLAGGGTSAQEWISWGTRFEPIDTAQCPALVVVAPHPDDEVLGLGATAALLAERGVEVTVVSVTDGGAAFPDLAPFDRIRLEKTRRNELVKALEVLRLRAPIYLGLPDGEVTNHEAGLADALEDVLAAAPPGAWCAATWRGDGHPDHEAVGRAAATATARTGVTLLEYPVWMWHWASPDDPAVPWQRARSIALDRIATGRKQNAAQCFQSQFSAPEPGVEPALPPFVLRRLLAVGELVFV